MGAVRFYSARKIFAFSLLISFSLIFISPPASLAQNSLPTEKQFTGHVFDQSSDLYYMRARYYDPVIGRFLSPDTGKRTSVSMNSYAYTENNPLRFIDPTGNQEEDINWTDWLVTLLTFDIFSLGDLMQGDPPGTTTRRMSTEIIPETTREITPDLVENALDASTQFLADPRVQMALSYGMTVPSTPLGRMPPDMQRIVTLRSWKSGARINYQADLSLRRAINAAAMQARGARSRLQAARRITQWIRRMPYSVRRSDLSIFLPGRRLGFNIRHGALVCEQKAIIGQGAGEAAGIRTFYAQTPPRGLFFVKRGHAFNIFYSEQGIAYVMDPTMGTVMPYEKYILSHFPWATKLDYYRFFGSVGPIGGGSPLLR